MLAVRAVPRGWSQTSWKEEEMERQSLSLSAPLILEQFSKRTVIWWVLHMRSLSLSLSLSLSHSLTLTLSSLPEAGAINSEYYEVKYKTVKLSIIRQF